MHRHILLIDCPDAKGLVYRVTGILYNNNCNLISNNEFVEHEKELFFMRTEFDGKVDEQELITQLRAQLPDSARIKLTHPKKRKIVICATKEHHCLADILIRCCYGDMQAEVLAIISNHDHLRTLAERFNVPYHYLPHKHCSREEHERQLLDTIKQYQPEYVVLAKYMRILSPDFIRRFPNHIINIHHSFLPAFIGANPYRQAYERGVKIIGATAHFVNEELDQGPIIVQKVLSVDHTHGAEDMAQAGHDVEQMVLAKALQLVFEQRVFLCGNRTVIFD